jgi:hypothetical protein
MQQPDGVRAANGFDALNARDANGDGTIDAEDPVWAHLLLWTDANHDGVSQSMELKPIAESAIVSIETGYQATRRIDEFGNQFRLRSRLRDAAGRPEPYFDIFFNVER